MKKIILTLTSTLFLIINLLAQSIITDDVAKSLDENAQSLWPDATGKFDGAKIPEKYNNESAVIIGRKRELSIDKVSRDRFFRKSERSLIFLENIRLKVKINDRNALNVFTTIYFRFTNKEDGFSAKIYKKSGGTAAVSLSDAVSVEDSRDVPEFFKSFFDQEVYARNTYYKVALPDLEVGDIVEYVSYTKNKLDVINSGGLIEFSPQYELCSKSYPVLFNQIAIELDDKSFFKALSKNGAPNFVIEPSNNKEFTKFVFTDVNRDVEKDVNFINSYKQSAFTKYQVIYANKNDKSGTLIGEVGEIKTPFSKEVLAEYINNIYKNAGNVYYANDGISNYKYLAFYFINELKKLGSKQLSDEEYIKTAYYRIRNYVGFRSNYLPDLYAMKMFSLMLTDKKIPNELVIFRDNKFGNLNEILFDSELRFGLKVLDKFYFNFTDYSNPGDLYESYLANDAYILVEPQNKKDKPSLLDIKLPDWSYTNSSSLMEIEASLTDDKTEMEMVRKNTYKGISKNNEIASALKYTYFMLEDYTNYGGNDPYEKMKPKEKENFEKRLYEAEAERDKLRLEHVKNNLEGEFGGKVKLKSYKINSDGRNLTFKDLIFTENFTLKADILKAGNNLIVNIPGLVGSQLSIKKDERIRNNDIDLSYAREIGWIIKFKIPSGYAVEGLKELNNDVNNEIGQYTCKAVEENGYAKINIKKVYKKVNFPKAKWNELLAFVDAAYNNSFKNILLRKL
jgi:hypothetical protein